MRVGTRLERLEALLGMDRCRLCRSTGPYAIAIQPAGFEREPGPLITLDGRPFPAHCPGCGRDLFEFDRPLKVYGTIDPHAV